MALYKIGAAHKPTAELDTFRGEAGDLFYSEQDVRLRISDGETLGGILITLPVNDVDISGAVTRAAIMVKNQRILAQQIMETQS